MSAPPLPAARVEPVRDVYFGETVIDPYRWMESGSDPAWLPFLRAQDAHTRARLAAVPGRESLARRIHELSGAIASTRAVQRAGGRLFYEQRPAGDDVYQLLVREVSGESRVLIDPAALAGIGGAAHWSLDWWEASPDGTHVAYGISPDGSEDSRLHIRRVTDAVDLPETIPDTEAADPAWIEDGSAFFYNRLRGASGTPERYLDSEARLHRLGTDPATDPLIMRRGLDPRVPCERIQMPHVLIRPGSRHALLILADVREEMAVYVAPLDEALAGRAHWRPVATFADEVTDVELDGERIILLVTHGAPRGRVVTTPATAPALARAEEIVPAGPLVLRTLAQARDALYVVGIDGGASRMLRVSSGQRAEVPLPIEGTISGLETGADQDGALFHLTGWFSPGDFWQVATAGPPCPMKLTPAPSPAIDVSGYASERIVVTARDGTPVPCSLIYRRGLVRDGRAPAYVSAYGAYGVIAYPPGFLGRALALVDAGFVIGFAHVRGGGEFGRDWHRAGQLEAKPNTWRDLIDVCEALCAAGWTSPAHLAIGGRSAGGVTVGRAMTERPALFAAVVSGVGWSNPLRYVAEQNSYGEEPEWGAIREEAGYRALRAIDSFHAVVDGTAYPAVLLTTGVTDPRVAPFHVAKMAARLQAASSSGRPVLLRVDFDAGHGMGSTRTQQDLEALDTFSFLLWQAAGREISA